MRTVNSRTEIRLIGNRITQRQEAGGRDISEIREPLLWE